MPFYQVLLAWIVGVPAVFVLPLVFLVLHWLNEHTPSSRGRNQFFLVLALILLNIWYLSGSFGYGTKYQGAVHTNLVAGINVVVFLSLLVSAYLAWRRPSLPHVRTNNLVLFVFLAWYAFPYLGELP